MNERPIYLDHHATTPMDPRVLEAMLPYFTERFGNAASRSHPYGWEADAAVTDARHRLVELLGAKSPDEIVFTSGATESNNLALAGVMKALGGGHVVTTTIEHACVEQTCRALESDGVTWTQVGVERDGVVSADAIESAIRPDTKLISVMAVNNEIGTVQPLRAIAAVAKRHDVLLHTDAAQAAGRIPIDVHRDGIDLLSLSAHKMYGPKGIGALYVRRSPSRTPLARQMHGGGQQGGMRSGTLDVPSIVGFGHAARLARVEGGEESERLAALRDRLLSFLQREIPELRVYGSMKHRVAGNLSLSFGDIAGDTMLSAVPGLALSGGAACSSGKGSHVLTALGVTKEESRRMVRVGLGRMTSEQDVELAGRQLARAARRVLDARTARAAIGEAAAAPLRHRA